MNFSSTTFVLGITRLVVVKLSAWEKSRLTIYLRFSLPCIKWFMKETLSFGTLFPHKKIIKIKSYKFKRTMLQSWQWVYLLYTVCMYVFIAFWKLKRAQWASRSDEDAVISCLVFCFLFFVVVFFFVGNFPPNREFLTHLETSPLPLKRCKCSPLPGTHGHWAVRVF